MDLSPALLAGFVDELEKISASHGRAVVGKGRKGARPISAANLVDKHNKGTWLKKADSMGNPQDVRGDAGDDPGAAKIPHRAGETPTKGDDNVSVGQKTGMSRLRRETEVVPEPLSTPNRPPGGHRFVMNVAGSPVGYMDVRNGQVDSSGIQDTRFKGMGLGKKMYGETMRRMPGQSLLSDGSVSDEATHVWESMRKKPGYKVEMPNGPAKKGVFFNTPENGSLRALYKGSLPAAAGIATDLSEPAIAPAAARAGGLMGAVGGRLRGLAGRILSKVAAEKTGMVPGANTQTSPMTSGEDLRGAVLGKLRQSGDVPSQDSSIATDQPNNRIEPRAQAFTSDPSAKRTKRGDVPTSDRNMNLVDRNDLREGTTTVTGLGQSSTNIGAFNSPAEAT